MKVYDNYEISGCAESSEYPYEVEQVADSDARFWTLYGHISGEGLEAIGDFATREAAEHVYTRITGQPFTGSYEADARLRLMHAAPRLLVKIQAVAELRRRWRSQDEAETIDSIEYMDGLDALDLDATIAKATVPAVSANQD